MTENINGKWNAARNQALISNWKYFSCSVLRAYGVAYKFRHENFKISHTKHELPLHGHIIFFLALKSKPLHCDVIYKQSQSLFCSFVPKGWSEFPTLLKSNYWKYFLIGEKLSLHCWHNISRCIVQSKNSNFQSRSSEKNKVECKLRIKCFSCVFQCCKLQKHLRVE